MECSGRHEDELPKSSFPNKDFIPQPSIKPRFVRVSWLAQVLKTTLCTGALFLWWPKSNKRPRQAQEISSSTRTEGQFCFMTYASHLHERLVESSLAVHWSLTPPSHQSVTSPPLPFTFIKCLIKSLCTSHSTSMSGLLS